MTAIKVTGILVASLALCGIAEAQKSGGKPGGGGGGSGDTLSSLNCSTDQIARFNGTAWVCSEDRAGVGSSYRFFDGNGSELPFQFYSMSTDGDQALVTEEVNIGGTLEPLRLRVDQEKIEIHYYNSELYYLSTDCSGTPLLRAGPYSGRWLNSRIISKLKYDESVEVYTLFYSDVDPLVTTENIGSAASVRGCRCTEIYSSYECNETVPMEVTRVAGSMPYEIIYQPPFKILRE